LATLRILEVFDSLQGEGVWSGAPMTFVRLSGCNAGPRGLDCVRWCDTAESWDTQAGEETAIEDLAERVGLPRACFTGGEPLLQGEGIARLAEALQARSVKVHVETNGTLALPAGMSPDWLTVSPKPPRYELHPALSRSMREIKVVVDASFDPRAAAMVQELARSHPDAVVALQPEAGGGQALTRRAVELVLAHPTWRLSLQLHKLLGIK
jgi:7-carboxy-7-deazaguanine synthase